MNRDLNQQNRTYWQRYQPGKIPSVPQKPPRDLLDQINDPILDVGTGDGVLAEDLARKGFQVYGIDIATNIINANQIRSSRVTYSVQDITAATSFADDYFDLLIFRFILTNIHKTKWKKLGDEVFRILKPGGKVWVLEPLVSPSYRQRYRLASHFVKDQHCVYVFFDPHLAEKVTTKKDLQKAIQENLVSRVAKHYTINELKRVFRQLALTDHRTIPVTSPSGFVINTFEGVFSKPNYQG